MRVRRKKHQGGGRATMCEDGKGKEERDKGGGGSSYDDIYEGEFPSLVSSTVVGRSNNCNEEEEEEEERRVALLSSPARRLERINRRWSVKMMAAEQTQREGGATSGTSPRDSRSDHQGTYSPRSAACANVRSSSLAMATATATITVLTADRGVGYGGDDSGGGSDAQQHRGPLTNELFDLMAEDGHDPPYDSDGGRCGGVGGDIEVECNKGDGDEGYDDEEEDEDEDNNDNSSYYSSSSSSSLFVTFLQDIERKLREIDLLKNGRGIRPAPCPSTDTAARPLSEEHLHPPHPILAGDGDDDDGNEEKEDQHVMIETTAAELHELDWAVGGDFEEDIVVVAAPAVPGTHQSTAVLDSKGITLGKRTSSLTFLCSQTEPKRIDEQT
jgi:hypothetical protein